MAFSFGQSQQSSGQNKAPFSFGTSSTSLQAPTAAAAGAGAGKSSSGFSFGNTTAAQSTGSQSSNSIFGQPAQQPASTGGFSFGTNTNQTNTQQQQPAASGFSFGGFGAKPAGQIAAPTGTSLFGNLGASTNNQQQQQKPAFSFGAPTQSNSTTTPLNFGASASQNPINPPQNAVASTSSAPITKSTRFEDLPEPARKTIEEIENFIQGRIAMYDILKSEKLGKEIEETSLTLRQLSTEFAALSNHLAHDSRHTADLRSRFEQSLRDGVKAVHIVDAFRAPAVTQPGGLPSQNVRPHPTFLQEFFRRKAEELTNRLAVYKMSIDQVQAQLSRSDPDQVKAILPTLKAQHSATLQLASKLSMLENDIVELKDGYRDLWRERTGSVRDPFQERRRQVLGAEAGMLDAIGGLSIRS